MFARPPKPPTIAPAPTNAAVAPGDTVESRVQKLNRRILDGAYLADPAIARGVRDEAAILGDAVFPSQLIAAISLDKGISVAGAQLYVRQFREAAGAPTDPVEQVLLDQLVLARMMVARQFASSEQAESPAMIRAFLNAGCRMMSETSKVALALSKYRSDRRREIGAGGQLAPATGPGRRPKASTSE